MWKARFWLLLFCVFLFAHCKKLEAPKETCFIPYVDFVAFNVNPSTLEVSFTAITAYNGTIKNQHWDFGDGTNFDGPTPPTHKFPPQNSSSANNSYRIKYSVANDCGEAYWTKDVVISPCLATVKFSYNIVNDSTVRFTNQTTSASDVTYEWTFGDGTKSTSPAGVITKSYQFDGNYVVSLKATNACGENYFIATVPICSKPVPAQQVQQSGCGTVTINASATKNGALYQWDLNNGTLLPAQPSASPTISYTYPAAGTYNIKLKVWNKAGCDSASTTSQVIIQDIALVTNRSWSSTSDDLTFSFRRNAVTNATGYKWDFGDGTTASLQNPDKIYASPGTYTITAIAFNQCMADTFKATVTAPFYKLLGTAPSTVLRDVTAISAQAIYVLGANGKLYKADTSGTWSGAINLPAALVFNNNTHLFRDMDDALWVYGRGEVAKFNPATATWTSQFSRTGYSNNSTIENITVDAAGNLWTISNNEVRRNNTRLVSPANIDFAALAYAPLTNRVWITATNRDELYYALSNSNILNAVLTSGITDGAGKIKVASNGQLFFSTPDGIISTSGTGQFIVAYNALTAAGLLTGNPQDFSLDNEGNLWVIVGGRLIKIPIAISGNAKNYSVHTTLSGLSSIAVLNISGTDNDLFLTKTAGNAVVHVK